MSSELEAFEKRREPFEKRQGPFEKWREAFELDMQQICDKKRLSFSYAMGKERHFSTAVPEIRKCDVFGSREVIA